MPALEKLFEKYDGLVFFDTETSGLKANRDQIIELAAIKLRKVDDWVVVEHAIDDLIKLPYGTRLAPFITNLTGISTALLAAQGKDEDEVAERFCQMLEGGKTLLIAHNARFDIRFVHAMLERHGKDRALRSVDCLDTLKVYKKRRAKNHKLCDAIEEYGLQDKVCNSHRAIDDVKALIEVTKAMDNERSDLQYFVEDIEGYLPDEVQYIGLF